MNKLMLRHTMDKPLPYDAEVEYLQANGYQYIDTGIIPNHTNEFDVDLTYIGDNGESQAVIGARNSNQQYTDRSNMSLSIWLGTSARYAANDKSADSGWLGSLTVNNRYILSIRNRKLYLDGVQKWSSGQTGSYNYTNTTIGLLHSHGTNNFWDTRRGHNLKLHGVKIYSYGQLVRDYIPVRKGNTGYLYDKVSGQLFGNQGTGSFVVGPDYNPFAYQYLTFVPLEDSTFSFAKRGTGNDIEYSIDGGAWTALASEVNTPTVAAGHNIRWRAELVPSTTSGSQGIGTFSATGLYDACGNIVSLLYGDNYVGQTTLVGTYTFCNLWREDAHIYKADRMVLPATTLASYCYDQMFSECTSLTTAPELPATTLVQSCYSSMFNRCTSLASAPELPATKLATSCYQLMFNGCVSLRQAPEMYATTLTTSCYNQMFRGCTSLTTIPELPATTLAGNCYYQMFLGCTSLTTIPKLQATELAANCYYQMFNGCTSLTTVLGLPATILKNQCYRQMFIHCSSLSYIKCLATDISASNSTYNWLSDVSSTGTFVKAAGMEDWTTGISGIPSGWTVVDDNS